MTTLPKIIGLTGGLASGKSSVANYFRNKGVPVFCADKIAHEALETTSPVIDKIVSLLGKKILNKDGTICIKTIAELIFNNPTDREKLESIIHPYVKNRINEEVAKLNPADHKHVIIDIPLLFEAGWENDVNIIMVVWCPEDIRIKRCKRKGYWNLEEIKKRINSQMSLEAKLEKADIVIDNSGSLDDLYKQLDKLNLYHS